MDEPSFASSLRPATDVESGESASRGPDASSTVAGLGSLAELIRKRSRQHGNRIAFIGPNRSWTYAELDDDSNRVANGLRAAGVGRGDRIACLTRHGAECALLLFAASKLGAVLAPLNWRLSGRELEYVLGVASPKVLVADAFMQGTIGELQRNRPRLVLTTDAPDGAASFVRWREQFPALDPGVNPELDEPVAQLFSSGTTGLPKGVELSHCGILVHCKEWVEPFRYRVADTTHLNVLPTFHVSGVVNAVWMVFLGGKAVFLPEFSPQVYLAAIETHRVTDAFAVPAMLRAMVQSPAISQVDLSSLRGIAYGGAPIDEALLNQCLERFRCGFVQVYGMTEASGTLTALLPDEHLAGARSGDLLRSVGKPGPHIDLKIVDPTSGAACAEGAVGEVWVRSSQLMSGYSADKAATAAAFPEGRDWPGGWMRTGDAGYLRNGYLFLHDRIKDMIISGGENIYPAEVENVLAGHPSIVEVAVIGVPDEKWGETVKACVVLQPAEQVTGAQLIAFARDRLAHYKCPTSVDFIEALPRNPSGKVLKRVLRERYWEGRSRQIS